MKKLALNIFALIPCLLAATIGTLIVPGIPMFIILMILAACNVSATVSDYTTTAFLLIWFLSAVALFIYLCILSAKLIGVYLRGHPVSVIMDNDPLIRLLGRVFRRKMATQLPQTNEQQQKPVAAKPTASRSVQNIPENPQPADDRSKKIRLVYLPILLYSVAFITAYDLLFWLLAIKWPVLDTMENLTEFGLPLSLAVVPVLLWQRPRLHLLDLEAKTGDRRPGYLMLLWAVVACTTMFSQFAIEKANRGFARLNNISEINSKKPVQCYSIRDLYIGKNNDCIYHTSFRSGSDLTLQGYAVYPIFTSPADTDIHHVAAWIGARFLKEIDDDLTTEQKKAERNKFIDECIKRARDTNISKFIYLEKPTDKDNYNCYVHAVHECDSMGKAVILLPISEPFEDDNGTDYAALAFFIFFIGALLWLPMFLRPATNNEELDLFLKGEQKHSLKQVFRFFIPKKGYYATPILVDINIAIYLVMLLKGPEFAMLGFEKKYLISWGANYTPLTLHGQWWRLLTCTFLHSGLMHIANNIVALMFTGMFFEKVIGAKKFFIVYFITGIAGSAVSVWWHTNAVSVGASGAVMGIYGVYFALLFTNILPKVVFRGFFRILSIIIVIGTLLIGLAPGIDNAAHVGGLVSGFILGFIFRPFLEPFTDKDVEGLADNFS